MILIALQISLVLMICTATSCACMLAISKMGRHIDSLRRLSEANTEAKVSRMLKAAVADDVARARQDKQLRAIEAEMDRSWDDIQ